MTPVSFAGIGTLVLVLEALAQFFGLTLPEGSATAAINGLVVFLGFVFLVWGQLRRKDLDFGLIRK